MRVAFLFTGQLRSFDTVWKQIEKCNAYYQADVFCHTWTDNSIHAEWRKYSYKNVDKETILSQLTERLHPKKIQIDEFDEKQLITNQALYDRFQDKHDDWYGYRGSRTIGALYSLYACNELKKEYEKENGFTYDLVVKTRYDCIFQSPFIDTSTYDKNYLWMHTQSTSAGINDVMYWSGSEVMDKLASCYLYIDTYFKNGIIIFGEIVLAHHINIQNISIKRHQFQAYCIRTHDEFVPEVHF